MRISLFLWKFLWRKAWCAQPTHPIRCNARICICMSTSIFYVILQDKKARQQLDTWNYRQKWGKKLKNNAWKWKMKNKERKMKNEKWKMKNEKWKMKNEKWKMKNEQWKTKNEKWKMKNEERKMKNEKWKMKNEIWMQFDVGSVDHCNLKTMKQYFMLLVRPKKMFRIVVDRMVLVTEDIWRSQSFCELHQQLCIQSFCELHQIFLRPLENCKTSMQVE